MPNISPLNLPSAILTRGQFRSRLGPILDRIEEELDGTATNRADIRRSLRKSKDGLLAADNVNLLFPVTIAGIQGLVQAGLASQAEADAILAIPTEDQLPSVTAPPGTVNATWDGWPVWAIQCPQGEVVQVQTPNGDVQVTYPDYVVTFQLGGAQYKARPTELIIL
jgi:hypothetical protein